MSDRTQRTTPAKAHFVEVDDTRTFLVFGAFTESMLGASLGRGRSAGGRVSRERAINPSMNDAVHGWQLRVEVVEGGAVVTVHREDQETVSRLIVAPGASVNLHACGRDLTLDVAEHGQPGPALVYDERITGLERMVWAERQGASTTQGTFDSRAQEG